MDRVRKTINRHKMLKEDDRVVVGISGGKDSAVLLDVLNRIEQRYPDTELVPVTIDEGIRGYRDQALQAARNLTDSLGLKLEVKSFEDLFGLSLDNMVKRRDKEEGVGACSYCGVFRRKALNLAAKELNADVVATGHNIDDEAQTIMMNIMRGDGRRIARTNRSRNRPIPGLVPRIKPITEVSERDIVAYAHYNKLPYHDVPCQYAIEAYRNDLRNFLNKLEHKRPGTLTAILRSGEAIAFAMRKAPKTGSINTCTRCDDPSPAKVCKACRLLEELN
jgi:uncharacterized protein (TIGR00269 family)